jgi:hypothetical protein
MHHRREIGIMTHRTRLKLASLIFAVLLTFWMIWSLSPMRPAEAGLFAIAGALAGLGWYRLYGAWYRWYFASHVFPRKRID